MEVTARDIQEQQFHDAWRGYNQEEVDDFLDQVAETIERLTRENDALRVRLRELEETTEAARATEGMLKKTLLSAQVTAEESIAEAKAEAQKLVADAEERARSADQEALGRLEGAEEDLRRKTEDIQRQFDSRKVELDESLGRLEAFESEIKLRLRSFLEQQLKALETLQERQSAGSSARVETEEQTAQPVSSSEHVEPTPVPVAESPPAPEDTQAFDVSRIFDHEAADETPKGDVVNDAPEHEESDQEAMEPARAVAELQASQLEDGDLDEEDDEIAGTEGPTVFDSLPRSDEEQPSLEDFKPFDDDAAALEGRRRRRLFRRRVDDWA